MDQMNSTKKAALFRPPRKRPEAGTIKIHMFMSDDQPEKLANANSFVLG